MRRGELDLALRLYDAQGGREPGSLRAIAAATLEREALAQDPQRSARAFAALRQAGTAAEPVLARLSESEEPATRVRALSLLAQLGDARAERALRAEALESGDPELQAALATALEPSRDEDAARLRALLDAPAAALRRAAVARLARAPASAETHAVLARAARLDPELGVRLGALRALSGQGAPGAASIEARLDDPNPEVRAAAAAAMVFADPVRARERLAPLLSGEPAPEAIEAARALIAASGQAAPETARSLLARALGHADAAVRGRAAVALMSLEDPALAAVAATRAEREPSRSVRMSLALSLPREHPARDELLRGLLPGRDPVSVQTAAELAAGGDMSALGRLRELLGAPDAHVRSAAARALGRDLGRAHEARTALRDDDATVRIAAAAAILSASARA